MTDNSAIDTEDLDAFSKDFFGQTSDVEDVKGPETNEEVDDDADLEDDSLANEDDSEDTEDDDPPAKSKKKSFQERIDEIVADKHAEKRAREAAEARAADIERKLQELEAKLSKEVPVAAEAEDLGPTPNDLDPSGNEKYPLGEFDPAYIRDLVKYENEKERQEFRKEFEKQQQELREQEETRKVQETLSNEWNQKLAAVEETLPDIREKGANLVEAFATLDQGHAEYLATAIMKLPNGPEVLYYLSDNIIEAKAIASKDPITAVIELGTLSARFSTPAKTEKKLRVSDAPEPPQVRTRGAGGKFTVPDDTDDLEAFERKFYG